jgi:hypothetical protein
LSPAARTNSDNPSICVFLRVKGDLGFATTSGTTLASAASRASRKRSASAAASAADAASRAALCSSANDFSALLKPSDLLDVPQPIRFEWS